MSSFTNALMALDKDDAADRHRLLRAYETTLKINTGIAKDLLGAYDNILSLPAQSSQ